MMRSVFKYLTLSILFSIIFSGIGILLELRKELLILLYSFGPLLVALISNIKWNFFNLKKIYWCLPSLAFPFVYLFIPNYLLTGFIEFLDPSLIAIVIAFIAASFEELFWRGFLFEKLKNISWFKLNVLIGLMWAIWHYPPIFTGNYELGGNLYVSVPMFTFNVVLLSFILGIFMKRSGLIVVPIVMHFTHNLIYKITYISPLLSEKGYLLTFLLVLFGFGAAIYPKLNRNFNILFKRSV